MYLCSKKKKNSINQICQMLIFMTPQGGRRESVLLVSVLFEALILFIIQVFKKSPTHHSQGLYLL